MGMTRIQKLRRQEFAEAASQTFVEHGVVDTTFERVAQKAGVAKSNVLHYFDNKTELIEAAFRHNALVFSREASALMRRAQSPWDRIYAVIQANFSPTSFQPEKIRSWIFMCAEAQNNETLGRLQHVMNQRVYSNLVFSFCQITDRKSAEAAALSLGLIIQGLWLRCGTEPGGIDRQEALDQIEYLLKALFPGDEARDISRAHMANIQEILLG